jgi:hypothetical protein
LDSHTPVKFPRLLLIGLAVAAAAPVASYGQTAEQKSPGAKAPAGMCRIWVDGVPADKQPAPTDCSTALRNKPTNAQVIFGDPRAPARTAPANVASRTMFPPANRVLTPLHATAPKPSSVLHEAVPPLKDSAKAGRDSGKNVHVMRKSAHEHTPGKKPPPR